MDIGDLFDTACSLDLPEDLGEIVSISEECPKVYYVATQDEEQHTLIAKEYYIVCEDTPVISRKAKQYGMAIGDELKYYVYDLGEPHSGHAIIHYEISRYRLQQGQPLIEDESLLSIARHAMELHPEYFGTYPAPLVTPIGYMTRSIKMIDGIFWVETDQGKEALAVSYPIWSGDLSDFTKEQVIENSVQAQKQRESSLGYAFYYKDCACLVLFELAQQYRQLTQFLEPTALMNAIWTHYPEYALAWNARESVGLNDIAGLFLQSIGVETELAGGAENVIRIKENGSCDYLRLDI